MDQLHDSDSIVQRDIEAKIQPLLQKYFKVELNKGKFIAGKNTNPTVFQIDYFNEEAGIFCEVYARIGKLKSGNKRKVLSDMLKLMTVEKLECRKDIKKCIVLTDENILKEFRTESWASKAVVTFGFELVFIALSETDNLALSAARELQKR